MQQGTFHGLTIRVKFRSNATLSYGANTVEVGLFSLEEAVRKMTSLTANALGINDRGVIAEGYFADLVLFNANTIIDSATFENPATPATGIEQVYVNGERVWHRLSTTGARPGRGLKRQALTPSQYHESPN